MCNICGLVHNNVYPPPLSRSPRGVRGHACAHTATEMCCAQIFTHALTWTGCTSMTQNDVQSRSLITKSDITNSGYNEAQKLILAKILLYMNRNVSAIANSGYNKISDITNWFSYPQWTITPLVTNQPLITNRMFGPCEKFKLDITKWLPSVREPFSKMAGKFADMCSASYGRWLVSAQAHEV